MPRLENPDSAAGKSIENKEEKPVPGKEGKTAQELIEEAEREANNLNNNQ